ncbi:Hypothetical protein NTJ_07773 [Nesidiocoris tenuis]|uniref:Uncharacterized protein n=1 Tax=Nesidiocoris tenuis TaxID=355587 RepID=A0ABN7ARX8_9HEMI|nr:Hypothetical protein NTJ_07773 [Nesidiocoris tenuis]
MKYLSFEICKNAFSDFEEFRTRCGIFNPKREYPAPSRTQGPPPGRRRRSPASGTKPPSRVGPEREADTRQTPSLRTGRRCGGGAGGSAAAGTTPKNGGRARPPSREPVGRGAKA